MKLKVYIENLQITQFCNVFLNISRPEDIKQKRIFKNPYIKYTYRRPLYVGNGKHEHEQGMNSGDG